MGDRSINYHDYATKDAGTGRAGVLLTDRPDMRIIRLSLLTGVLALLLIAGIIVFVLPIDQGTRNGLLGFAAIFGYVVISIPLIWYVSLVKAVYTLSREHIEVEGGVISKTSRCIPLSYVRDVTFNQSVIQAMFGLSTITVSTTNGDRIRFQHVRDGKQKHQLIWNLVLSKSPGNQREA